MKTRVCLIYFVHDCRSHNFFVEMKCTTLWNDIFTFSYKHFTPYGVLFSDLNAELFSARYFINLNFGIFLENYRKII